MEFKELKLREELLQAITKLGYVSCTPVQVELIPAILAGHDCVVQAKTGSGKTAAFGLGVLSQIIWEENRPQVMILAPTRELALQIQEEIDALGLYMKIKSVLLLGRQPYKRQMEQLKSKSHIVIGTPGRIKDHLTRGTLDLSLVKTVILDEGDQMLNMGFIDEVKSILKHLPKNVQSILCSATMPPEIQAIAGEFLHNPETIVLETTQENQIQQHLYYVDENKKSELLVRLLASRRIATAIIFATTQEEVDTVFDTLDRLGFSCERLHGGMMQNERFQAMDQFRKGMFRYLVATDVAARGIDVEQLSMVVNLHLPRSHETYVHRIGRSGRMHEQGEAVLFATKRERKYVDELFEELNQTVICEDSDILLNKTISDEDLAFIASNPQSRITKQEKMRDDVMRLYLNGGKNKKIRVGDIVGAICELKGITGDDIGVIDVLENGSTVDILNNKGKEVLHQLQDTTIKGKKLRVEKAK